MADGRLQFAILRAASLLAPAGQRAAWLDGWRSELWYFPRRGATRFCLGAFRDAFWLRRNNLEPVKASALRLKSPLRCLAFLAVLAALCGILAICLPAPVTMTRAPYLKIRDLPGNCAAMLLISCVFLPAIRLAMGSAAVDSQPAPWSARLRPAIFLALKIALIQPVLLCGFLAAHNVPLGSLLLWPVLAMPCRWVLIDQRRRCPVCLRLLTSPVRIGTPSQTFLGWYAAESICARGHGLMQTPGISASYAGKRQWLCLDNSWSGLF